MPTFPVPKDKETQKREGNIKTAILFIILISIGISIYFCEDANEIKKYQLERYIKMCVDKNIKNFNYSSNKTKIFCEEYIEYIKGEKE
jgi:uncharacterized membrane protein